MDTSKLSRLQQAIWDLQTARANIAFAKGASDVGKIYVQDINGLIENIQDDIDNIWSEYEE
jgi:hypothetical protein